MDEIDLGIDVLAGYDDGRSIDLDEARKLVRGRGGPVNLMVLRRWCARGCRPLGESGPVLRLPAVKLAQQWRTLPEWVAAFERKRAELGRTARPAPAARPARARKGDQRRAEEYLKKAGVT